MEKSNLKELQSSRILNMSDIYRELDFNPDYINTKLGRPRSHIDKQTLEQIQKKIIDRIKAIIDYADIPIEHVIPRLLTDLTPDQARKIFDGMESMAVEPIGYIEREDAMHALFLPEDQYRPRMAEHNAKSRFMDVKRMMGLPQNLQLTDRGRGLLSRMAEEAS